jgi:urease accessory protein
MDGETVLAWITTLLESGAGWSDAVILKEAFQAACEEDQNRLRDAADLAEALCPSAERLRETRDQGRAFLAASLTWAKATGAPLPPLSEAPYPVAVGSCAAQAGVPLTDVLPAFLHAFASNLVTIAVRVAPLGQTAGVSVLARLLGTMTSTARRASLSTLDDLGGCALGSDIASMRHESLETRLFIS